MPKIETTDLVLTFMKYKITELNIGRMNMFWDFVLKDSNWVPDYRMLLLPPQ